jgi:hypothetical protein
MPVIVQLSRAVNISLVLSIMFTASSWRFVSTVEASGASVNFRNAATFATCTRRFAGRAAFRDLMPVPDLVSMFINFVQLGDDQSNGPGPSQEKTSQLAAKSVFLEAIIARNPFVDKFVFDELKVPLKTKKRKVTPQVVVPREIYGTKTRVLRVECRKNQV